MKNAITMFQEAAQQVQNEEAYKKVMQARELNDKDENLQALIGEFNLVRVDLNKEMTNAGDKDQTKINELNQKANDLYTDIMECDSMIEYNEAKDEMEQLISHIQAIIDTAINGGDPFSVTEPPAGCDSGDCSGCSGCG